MDLGIESSGWRRMARGLAGAASGRPEWHALRARLGAAYCARQALGEQRPARPHTGSFDRDCARIVTGYDHAEHAEGQGLAPINPIGLIGGKPHADILGPVAGANTAGDRG